MFPSDRRRRGARGDLAGDLPRDLTRDLPANFIEESQPAFDGLRAGSETIDRRFRLTAGPAARAALDLGREVARGLQSEPKQLPCRFFYDEEGSRLFEEICRTPEYYVTRAEDEILAARSDEIASAMPERTLLVELGSGNAEKTRRLIEAVLARSGVLDYMPIDISRSALEASSRRLLAAYPALSIHALADDYDAATEVLRAEQSRAKLVLWLGSNVGNFDRVEAARFLERISSALAARDGLLVGIDLRKSRSVLERAYDDARGVTARFNLNLLARINSELGGHFDLDRFRHVALYEEHEGRIEMYLESRVPQTVRIDALDLEVSFARGERIHTENSYKYSAAEIDELCRAARLSIERRWLDSRSLFALHLLHPSGADGARARGTA
jgi:dimethylhistidine N-methyltransferase